MTPQRNIHRMLVVLLFTVGTGLLLMGVQTGHQALFAENGWGWDDQVASVDGARDSGGGDLNTAGKKVFHSEGQGVQSHKIYKRIRGRSGPDLFHSTFSISYYHPQMVPLPEMYGASIYTAIRVTSFLRGPPCA